MNDVIVIPVWLTLKKFYIYFFVFSLLTLRRYDTIKTFWWFFFRFSELFIIRKYVQTSSKTGCHHVIFSVLGVKRSNILKKLSRRDCFCLHSWLYFLWRFSSKKLICTLSLWFNFVFGSVFEQYHQLNYFIFMRKDDLSGNSYSPKSDW